MFQAQKSFSGLSFSHFCSEIVFPVSENLTLYIANVHNPFFPNTIIQCNYIDKHPPYSSRNGHLLVLNFFQLKLYPLKSYSN